MAAKEIEVQLETKQLALVGIDYKNIDKPSGIEHWVTRDAHHDGHVGAWENFFKNGNKLDAAWTVFPKPNKDKVKEIFPIGKIIIPAGSGTKTVEWTVWEKSAHLTTNSLELYAVMRAEKYYIEKGYTKLGSMYAHPFFRTNAAGKVVYKGFNENVGVDSFFRDRQGTCVFCESKFTGDLKQLNRWKRKNDGGQHENLWKYLRAGGKSKSGFCPMSWEWIQDRAARALKKPSGLKGLDETKDADAIKKAARWDRAQMVADSLRMVGKRTVNVYGAEEVPIYPGRYRFVSDLNGIPSENILNADWSFAPEDDEFIELGKEFDEWLSNKEPSAAQVSSSSTASDV